MADKLKNKDIQNDNRHLYRLNELADFKVASEDPDVRGWEVLDRDNEKFGTVRELIVDPAQERVRYLDIEPSGNVTSGSTNERLLIPIGTARLKEDRHQVVVNNMDKSVLRDFPLYKGNTVTRDYEIDVVERFNRPSGNPTANTSVPATAVPASADFYSAPLYDETRFYTNRSKNRNI